VTRRKNPRLKKPNSTHEYTLEEIQELAKCAEDPVYCITKYIKIRHPTKGFIPFDMWECQKDIVRAYNQNRFVILLASRQVGKTETSAAYLLWYALFNPYKTVVILSNKSSSAKEIIAKIQDAYEELPYFLKPGIDENSWNKHECKWENKSRIVAQTTSIDSARGLSISLLYLDEFAFVKNHIQEEFWTSVIPTLSTGGSCIISSTPNGDSNRFAQLWREANMKESPFVPVHIPWNAPPGRDEKFKQDFIALLGERKWLQEFECKFLSSDYRLIDDMALTRVKERLAKKCKDGKPPVEMNVGDIEFYKKPSKSMSYLVSVDVSTGSDQDYSVISVTEFPSMIQTGMFRSSTTSEKFLYSKLKNLLLFLEQNSKDVYFSVENNGVGSSILAIYEFDQRPPSKAQLISDANSKRLGITMSEPVKRRTALKLKSMIENDEYDIRSPLLIEELNNYTRQGATFKAEKGATDDIVASLLIMVRMLEELADFNAEAYNKVYDYKGYDDKHDEWGDSADSDEPFNPSDYILPIIVDK